jgi:hypothetical protein
LFTTYNLYSFKHHDFMGEKISNMKKLALGLFLATLFTGCAKQKGEITDLTKEVMEQKSIPAMRQAYGFLSVTEKSTLWLTKLDAVLNNDAGKLTAIQREIVLEIKGMLEKHGMAELIKDGSIGESFLSSKLNGYRKHFTNQQLYLLIENPYYKEGFSIFQADNYLSRVSLSESDEELPDDPGGGGSGTNCTCYYNISCGLGGYCDWKVSCTQVAQCGLFGTSNCKGKC